VARGVSHKGAWLLLAISLSLAGCTAADLQTPIAGFSGAATAANSSLALQQGAIDKALLDYSVAAALKTSVLVRHKKGECEAGTPSCRLYVKFDNLDWPVTPGAIDHGVLVLAAAVADYGTNLLNIAKATTASQIQSALGETKSRVIALAGTIDTLDKAPKNSPEALTPKVTAYGGPVADLVSYGLTQYTERVKLDAIRSAVDQMERVFDPLTVTFSRVAKESALINSAMAHTKFVEAENAYTNSPADKDKLIAYQAAAETYDAVLKQPQEMFEDLRKAHAALAKALDRQNLTSAELWDYLQKVSDSATQLANIIKQLEDAGKKS
jgi:hypothetical protein